MQNTVFGQVIKLIPRTIFESMVSRHNADRRVRELNSWTWFGALLFGQLSGHDSIRSIERVFACNDSKMKRLGFGAVRRSTLSDANAVRSLDLLEDLFEFTLSRATKLFPKNTPSKFHLKGDIFSMDSSTIDLCLTLCPWAIAPHFSRGACKLHTAIDVRCDLPQFAVITHGHYHDTILAREIVMGFRPGDTLIFDRGYFDYDLFNSLNQNKVTFVTRMKKNISFKVMKSAPVDRTQGFRADQIIYLSAKRGERYKGKLRRVSFRDPVSKKWLVFLTNNFSLSVRTIAELYKARWKVELFFKTLKQNLRIKKFLGTSENAVKAQILVALIAYLLVQTLRFSFKSNISIPDALAVIGVMLLMKESISKLLTHLPKASRHPPPQQLPLAFI